MPNRKLDKFAVPSCMPRSSGKSSRSKNWPLLTYLASQPRSKEPTANKRADFLLARAHLLRRRLLGFLGTPGLHRRCPLAWASALWLSPLHGFYAVCRRDTYGRQVLTAGSPNERVEVHPWADVCRDWVAEGAVGGHGFQLRLLLRKPSTRSACPHELGAIFLPSQKDMDPV